MPQRKAFLMAGASLKMNRFIYKKGEWVSVSLHPDSSWPPAPSHPLNHPQTPIVSTSTATLHLVPALCLPLSCFRTWWPPLWAGWVTLYIIVEREIWCPGPCLPNPYWGTNDFTSGPECKTNEAQTKKVTGKERGFGNQNALVWLQPCHSLAAWLRKLLSLSEADFLSLFLPDRIHLMQNGKVVHYESRRLSETP